MTTGHSNVSVSTLDAAYRATSYQVEHDGGRICIRIGQTCEALDRLLKDKGLDSWAFISACNPASQILPVASNLERHQRLIIRVEALGFFWLPGLGIPDQPGWQPEQSVLIPGIHPDKALQLAAQFQQNAIVTGTPGAAAQLRYVHGNTSG